MHDPQMHNLKRSTNPLVKPQTYMYLPLLSLSLKVLTLAIQEAKVAIPPQRDDIDNQNSMMKRNQLEVDSLNERPNHPILLQRIPIRLIQLIFRAGTFHDGHATQEDE